MRLQAVVVRLQTVVARLQTFVVRLQTVVVSLQPGAKVVQPVLAPAADLQTVPSCFYYHAKLKPPAVCGPSHQMVLLCPELTACCHIQAPALSGHLASAGACLATAFPATAVQRRSQGLTSESPNAYASPIADSPAVPAQRHGQGLLSQRQQTASAALPAAAVEGCPEKPCRRGQRRKPVV